MDYWRSQWFHQPWSAPPKSEDRRRQSRLVRKCKGRMAAKEKTRLRSWVWLADGKANKMVSLPKQSLCPYSSGNFRKRPGRSKTSFLIMLSRHHPRTLPGLARRRLACLLTHWFILKSSKAQNTISKSQLGIHFCRQWLTKVGARRTSVGHVLPVLAGRTFVSSSVPMLKSGARHSKACWSF